MAGDISWRILSCVEDVRALLSASFLWSVSWINREANCAYHFFARWSLQNLLWGPIEFCIGLHGFQVVCLENGPDCQLFLILLFLNRSFVKKKKKCRGQGTGAVIPGKK